MGCRWPIFNLNFRAAKHFFMKKRPRSHIIESLGFNHIERQILLSGCLLYRYYDDYGYDGAIHLFSHSGEIKNGQVQFQLKSTDHINYLPEKDVFTFDLSDVDLELWLSNNYTVLLILYDARKNKAYYLDLQEYFRENSHVLRNMNKFVRVYIPRKNRFTPRFIQKFKI